MKRSRTVALSVEKVPELLAHKDDSNDGMSSGEESDQRHQHISCNIHATNRGKS